MANAHSSPMAGAGTNTVIVGFSVKCRNLSGA
jgi:hypothetical protein